MPQLNKLNLLGLSLFVLTSVAACAQLLGDVTTCTDEPGKPCDGVVIKPNNPPLGAGGSGGDDQLGFNPDVIVVPITEPCTELDALRCNGPEFQRCSPAAQGLGWLTLQACRTDALCMSGDADQVAGCRLAACNAGQYTCNGAVLQTCSDDLTSYVVADVCLSSAHCDKDTGACKEVPCQPGETRCNDKALERCSDDQTGWVPQIATACESLELCEITRQQAATTCQPPACEAGAVVCDGSNILQCNAGRTAMEPIADCLTAALCAQSVAQAVPGATVECIDPQCDAGEFRCDGANLLLCNADRTGFNVERSCDGPPFCNAAMAEQGIPAESPGCLTAPCEPGETICNGAQPARCRDDQLGFDPLGPACASRGLCVDGNANQPASCRAPTCLRGPGTNEFRCNGAQLQQCNTQLTGYDTIATCASAGLCGPRANGCAAPVCSPGQRRCNPANGSVEVCNAQLTGFQVESNCGGNGCRQGPPPVCNTCVPGSPASCTNGDIVTCNNGVANTSDCGASGCRATTQGPLCNACTPGSPPSCTGGDIVTCTGGVPQLQDCGAPGCRTPIGSAPVCNDCVPGSVPTCTNGDIVGCSAAGTTSITDCGAPGCRVTQQGPVCNQCVPNSPSTCSNGDLVACNANGTPVITDCGAPGCRNTPQGPQCNQCAVGAPGACNDNNVCTSDVCSAPGSCTNPAAPAGTPCGNGNVCNGAGACVQCSASSQCDDGNACTTDTCTAGTCRRTPVAAGASCGGGNVCSATGVCVQCTTNAQCDDGNACTTETCGANGVCTRGSAAPGTPCGGGNVCTGTGSCVECTTQAQCDDRNPCTNDSCNMTTAECSNPPAAAGTICGAGLVCNAAGACVQCATNADCSGGNECNTAVCSPAGTCTTTPSDAACADRFACTIDSCTPTGCAHRADNTLCGASTSACSTPVCDLAQGCIEIELDDGSDCTLAGIPGSCESGTCVPSLDDILGGLGD